MIKMDSLEMNTDSNLVFISLSTKEGIAASLIEESENALLLRHPIYMFLKPGMSRIKGVQATTIELASMKLIGINYSREFLQLSERSIIIRKQAVLFMTTLAGKYLEVYKEFIEKEEEESENEENNSGQ